MNGLITQGLVGSDQVVAPAPNYGGFAGRPCPDFPMDSVLLVKWWNGAEWAFDFVTVQEPADKAGATDIAWASIQTWMALPL